MRPKSACTTRVGFGAIVNADTSRDVVINDVLLTSPKAPKWSHVVICDEFVTIFIWSQNWRHICVSVTKWVFSSQMWF
jgi:hypothetical protein